MTSGQALRLARERLNISQREVGERLGITHQRYAHYEHDRWPVPKRFVLPLARILRATLPELGLEPCPHCHGLGTLPPSPIGRLT